MALAKIQAIFGVLVGKKEFGADGYRRFSTILEQIGAEADREKARRLEHFAARWSFNAFVALMIMVNSIVLGVNVDSNLGGALDDRLLFFFIDFVFAVLFFVEMLARQHQLGWDFFMDPWNFFDYTIVVINCVDIVVSVTSVDGGGPKLASTLRVLRLLRVARYVRGLKMFFGMWMVIEGLVNSLRALVWTGIMLLILVYVFGVSLVTLVDQEPRAHEEMPHFVMYAGSVRNAMVTIVQVLTLDAWASGVGRELLDSGCILGLVLIVFAIVILNFGVLNIIVALMVEKMAQLIKGAEASNGKMIGKTEEKILMSLGHDFHAADTDSSGELDYDEFLQLIRSQDIAFKLRLLGIQMEEAESFFDLMDVDNSGFLSPEEFIDGLQRIRGLAKGKDICQLICFAQRSAIKARDNVQVIKNLVQRADVIQERLNVIGRSLTCEVSDRKDRGERTQLMWHKADTRQQILHNMDRDRCVTFPGLAPQMY